jgi:hypothetical protein
MRIKLEFEDGTVAEYDAVSVTIDVHNVRLVAPYEDQVKFMEIWFRTTSGRIKSSA